jgi:hypothetical protein
MAPMMIKTELLMAEAEWTMKVAMEYEERRGVEYPTCVVDGDHWMKAPMEVLEVLGCGCGCGCEREREHGCGRGCDPDGGTATRAVPNRCFVSSIGSGLVLGLVRGLVRGLVLGPALSRVLVRGLVRVLVLVLVLVLGPFPGLDRMDARANDGMDRLDGASSSIEADRDTNHRAVDEYLDPVGQQR